MECSEVYKKSACFQHLTNSKNHSNTSLHVYSLQSLLCIFLTAVKVYVQLGKINCDNLLSQSINNSWERDVYHADTIQKRFCGLSYHFLYFLNNNFMPCHQQCFIWKSNQNMFRDVIKINIRNLINYICMISMIKKCLLFHILMKCSINELDFYYKVFNPLRLL
jgi:hypothetical protein